MFIFNNEPTRQAYTVGLWIYLWWEQTNWLCITFHVQRHSGGHYKQQNMLGLGKEILDFNR